MREAASVMGIELSSSDYWTSCAIHWLSARGTLSIHGNDEEGWIVTVCAVCSGGHSLTEALCGAIHAIASETAKVDA